MGRRHVIAAACAVGMMLGVNAAPASADPAARGAAQTVSVANHPELLRVFGPYYFRQSGSAFYNLTFSVDRTFSDHCVQNDGAGAFQNHRTQGIYVSHLRTYSCGYLLTTRRVLADRGLLGPVVTVDGLGHDYYDSSRQFDPEYSNPDRDSTRYRFLNNAKYTTTFGSFLLGSHMSPEYYEGSPAGADGYYYTIKVTCDPTAVTGRPFATPEEVRTMCVDAEMAALADRRTTGPQRILVIGTDSPYYPPPPNG